MSGYPAGGGQQDYRDGYGQNTDSYYQDDHNGQQYYDQHANGYDAHGQQHNDGYYDES